MHPFFQARYGYQLLCAGYVNVPPCIIYIACVRDIFLYHSQMQAVNINIGVCDNTGAARHQRSLVIACGHACFKKDRDFLQGKL